MLKLNSIIDFFICSSLDPQTLQCKYNLCSVKSHWGSGYIFSAVFQLSAPFFPNSKMLIIKEIQMALEPRYQIKSPIHTIPLSNNYEVVSYVYYSPMLKKILCIIASKRVHCKTFMSTQRTKCNNLCASPSQAHS